MKIFFLAGLFFTSFNSFAAVDEEILLIQKASLLAKRTHISNISLVGLDPVNCKPSDDHKLLLKQMKDLNTGPLKHCPEVVSEKLKEIDEQLKQIDQGVLPPASPLQIASISNPLSTEKERETPALEYVTERSDREPTIPVKSHTPDSTGLSDEQRDYLFSEYNRNSHNYRPTEEDDLFDILSKAYIRNYDKVMKRQDKEE